MHKVQKLIQENFLIDKSGTGELVPFFFNPVQSKYFQMLVNDYGENFWESAPVREQIIKARQEGFTSMILAIFASVMILVPTASRFLEISYKIDATKQHFSRMKRFFLSLFTHDKKKWDQALEKNIFDHITEGQELAFKENFSSFYAGTATGRTGERGGNLRGALLTESAHYPDTGILSASEIIEGTRQMIPVDGGLLFRETTANGWNHEKKCWDMAKVGEVDYRPRFFGWKEFYTPEQFKKIELGFADKTLVPQEFPATAEEAFLFSGRPAFDQAQLKKFLDKTSDPRFVGALYDDGLDIEFKERKDGNLKIWKMPRPARQYLISADVAEGIKGGAYSVAHVIDRSSWEEVAVWRGHVDPGEFGKILVDMGYFFNNAILIPENNNHGWATLERIKSEGYPHVLETRELWPEKERVQKGFPTNSKTRKLVISALRAVFSDMTIFLNDAVTVQECMAAVIDEGGDAVAQSGYFFDCVISLGIGVYCLKFLSLDETYASRAMESSDAPMVVQSIGGRRDSELDRGSWRDRRGLRVG